MLRVMECFIRCRLSVRVLGACLNVKINAAGLKDRAAADALVAEANSVAAAAERAEREVLEIVERKI